eukprot:g9208.t1
MAPHFWLGRTIPFSTFRVHLGAQRRQRPWVVARARGRPKSRRIRPPMTRASSRWACEVMVARQEYEARMRFLDQVPLMKRLPRDEHPIVAEACEACEFQNGDVIIQQGDPGDAKGGDYFGENALLRDEPRTATIIASSRLLAFRIRRDKFQELGLNAKLQFANRKAVGAGMKAAVKCKPPTPKTPEDVEMSLGQRDESEMITLALQKNENLATMTTLDPSRLQSFIEVMWKEEVKAGERIISEGDLQADYFYVVASGQFEVMVCDSDAAPNASENATAAETGEESQLPPPPPPADAPQRSVRGSFGELALLYFVPRAATVVASTDATVWVIDRSNFKNILMKASDSKIRAYVKYLDKVSILDALLAEEKKQVANALVEMHFASGDKIIQQGEPGNMFYIMYEGDVNIDKDGEVVATLSAKSKSGTVHFFGEMALLENENRTATVVVTSSERVGGWMVRPNPDRVFFQKLMEEGANEDAKCLVLDRESFNLLLGPLKDIIEAAREGRERPERVVPQAQGCLAENRTKIKRSELKRIGLLGCGGFGAVELWEHSKTGQTFALKAISKGYIVKTGMQERFCLEFYEVESIMNEKAILAMTNSLFITKLYETYNGTQTLYFLLEPCLGGELYSTYVRKSLYGSEKHCRFYSACVINAFEHMHQRRTRLTTGSPKHGKREDLKPENLLLTEEGHLKVTDMGLAKFVIGKTYTTCGTPDYFAPEVIASTGHTNAVDWWTLGILIFELMAGHPPFESAYPMQIYAKVTKGIGKVPFPSVIKGTCRSLIESLLKTLDLRAEADGVPVFVCTEPLVVCVIKKHFKELDQK